MDAWPAIQLIEAAVTERPFVLVGIGGRGGSGKSTLARSIPGAQVVGTDEFWDGSEFDLGRLDEEVIRTLLAGGTARFHGFDWAAGRPHAEERCVLPQGIVVIEGVCALHRRFRDAYDVRIWVDAPYEVRLARGIERDGDEARRIWEQRWMPSEERYIARDDPIPSAHLRLDGSGRASGRS